MSTDINSDPLAELRNEVFRRIGRNLLLFQQIEGMLKLLIANSRFEGTAQGPTEAETKRQNALQKKTFGDLRNQFFAELATPPEVADPKLSSDAAIRVWFTLTRDTVDKLQADKGRYEAMTQARNELAHHFFDRFQLGSEESLVEALSYLDMQRQDTLPFHGDLKQLLISLAHRRKVLAEHMASPEGAAAMELMHLQKSKVVGLLIAATRTLARKDGWTSLASAGLFIATRDPEELSSIELRFGFSGLHALVEAAGLFDLLEQTTAKGGTRTVYRLKPGADRFQ